MDDAKTYVSDEAYIWFSAWRDAGERMRNKPNGWADAFIDPAIEAAIALAEYRKAVQKEAEKDFERQWAGTGVTPELLEDNPWLTPPLAREIIRRLVANGLTRGYTLKWLVKDSEVRPAVTSADRVISVLLKEAKRHDS